MVARITIDELSKVVVWNHIAKRPVVVVGRPGIGKSEGTIQAGKTLQEKMYKDRVFVVWDKLSEKEKENVSANPKDFLVLLDKRLSMAAITDVQGIPYKEAEYVKWYVERYLWFFTHPDSAGILLYDEFNQARKEIINGFFKIFHDRVVNDVPLSENVSIVGLGNLGHEDGTYVHEMTTAMKDRVSEYRLEFDREKWIDYVYTNNIVNTDVLAFLEFKTGYLSDEHKTDDELKRVSPRGLVIASEIIAESEKVFSNLTQDDIRLILSGRCNEAFAREFLSFMELKKQVKISDILKKPEMINEINRPDLLYTAIAGLVDRYKENTKHLDSMVDIAMYISQEYGAWMLKMMIAGDKTFINKLSKQKRVKELTERYMKVLGD